MAVELNFDVGSVYRNNEGCEALILNIDSRRFVVVSFLGYDNSKAVFAKDKIIAGRFKNPYKPRVCGVGFMGTGKFIGKVKGVATEEYAAWHSMLQRCYQVKGTTHQTRGVTVEASWHNFQEFAEWYTSHHNYGKGYHLDKDILQRGNNIYSADMCCLVPRNVNALLCNSKGSRGDLPLGVSRFRGKYRSRISIMGKEETIGHYSCEFEAFYAYKSAKESYIKSVVEKYSEVLEDRVQKSLLSYRVYITD